VAVRFASHFGICVSDPARSLAFYRDLLGFREAGALEVSDAHSARLLGLGTLDLRARFLERDGMRLELMHFAEPGCERDAAAPRPMNRTGLTHVALRVDDLAATLAALERAGVEVMRETRIRNPELRSEVVYVLDPDGVRIELVEVPGDPTQPLVAAAPR
jgi:catechol 2,3-dioxygenase-like lactoylglutathione lyase family enzyme